MVPSKISHQGPQLTSPHLTSSLSKLLLAPASVAAGTALLDWVRSAREGIDRGDMEIGILTVADVQQAPAALRRAAEWGVPEAWLDLASWQINPPLGTPDLAGATEALRSAITAGVAGAEIRLVELRWFHQRESASSHERVEAFQILNEVLRQTPNDAKALHLLGFLTCQGFGTNADPAAAFELQRRAAALGSADAVFELAIHYSSGLGVDQDDQAAFDAMKDAANAGNLRALYNMGSFHATGRYVAKNLPLAVEWYTRAADAGHARAALTLAVMYATGEGVEQDTETASEYFEAAEHLGLDVQSVRESVGM